MVSSQLGLSTLFRAVSIPLTDVSFNAVPGDLVLVDEQAANAGPDATGDQEGLVTCDDDEKEVG